MDNTRSSYFCFPRLTLFEKDLRNFSIFLPQLHILEITRPAAIPEWCGNRLRGWPITQDTELLSQIKSCLHGYHAFAELHGSSGTLGFLSQIVDDTIESRLAIQEQLRGKCSTGGGADTGRIVNASLFLEIARELDEKYLELDLNYARADALEKQFRDILGISGEEESEAVAEGISTPLGPETGAPEYMPAERIRSWFRLFSLQTLLSPPVFVASSREYIDECLEIIRSGSPNQDVPDIIELRLGAFPAIDNLGQKQFQSLVGSPGAPALLDAYRRDLDQFLSDAGPDDPDTLQRKADSLGQILEKFCRSCESEERVTLRMVLVKAPTLSNALPILCGSPDMLIAQSNPEIPNRPITFLYVD